MIPLLVPVALSFKAPEIYLNDQRIFIPRDFGEIFEEARTPRRAVRPEEFAEMFDDILAIFPFPAPLLAAAAANSGGSFTTGQTIITTTGSGSWTVATGFNPGNNTIELIGSGGKACAATSSDPGTGGGGGQYAKLANFNPGGSTSISYQVGAVNGSQGTAASPGTGDSWFSSASSVAYAQAGQSPTTPLTTGSTGGNAAAVGSCTVANGGGGGGSTGAGWTGPGGGGAGGPHGAGGNGGGQGTSSGAPGGSGGNADNNTVTGPPGTANANGTIGNTENLWATGKGPSTGGSGGGNTHSGGAGGSYGGGGGGAAFNVAGQASGGQGILVISWAP